MNNDKQSVVLVDKEDRTLASLDKMEAHQLGLLHRAFSVFIFDRKGNMLIHQRALSKYHCGGLWTNACCSHPYINELPEVAAQRRLQEELGFTCEVTKVFDFVYKATFDNGFTEHEFDHVFVGTYEGAIETDKNEVAQWKYVSIDWLMNDLALHTNIYTPWFKIALPMVLECIKKKKLAA